MDQSTLQSVLEKLRASSAYANVVASSSTPPGNLEPPPSSTSGEAGSGVLSETSLDPSGVSSRISSLLSRLRPQSPQGSESQSNLAQVFCADADNRATTGADNLDGSGEDQNANPSQSIPQADYRSLTYAESLSRVEEILKDPRAVDALLELKRSQDELETKLWNGREHLKRKHDERIQAAKTTARIVTGSEQLEEKEIQRLQDELVRAEREYDLKHVLPAWDAMVNKQQTTMEKLGVPAMFTSTDLTERARQQRIVRVMEQGLIGDADGDL